MVLEMIQHTPLWVFAIFALLIYRGIAATRDRAVQFAPLILLATAFAILGAQGAIALAHAAPVPVAMWALAFSLAVVGAGTSMKAETVFGRREAPMQRGSVVPLILILAIFTARYSVGVVLAMHPELLTGLGASAAICGVYGALSGLMVGRALKVLLLAQKLTSNATAQTILA